MKLSYRAFAASPDDEIVISGIAGRFPKSANVAEFSDNLYNKVIHLMFILCQVVATKCKVSESLYKKLGVSIYCEV
jgi:hypothetical protein